MKATEIQVDGGWTGEFEHGSDLAILTLPALAPSGPGAADRYAPLMLSVLRIVSALIFMEHGTQKWLNFPPLNRPGPELASMSGAGGVIELVGGALLVLGLFSRPVAFILSGEMAIA